LPRKTRPSSSARIACILAPGSGFSEFYQGSRQGPSRKAVAPKKEF
jgi:hypothetical protein